MKMFDTTPNVRIPNCFYELEEGHICPTFKKFPHPPFRTMTYTELNVGGSCGSERDREREKNENAVCCAMVDGGWGFFLRKEVSRK